MNKKAPDSMSQGLFCFARPVRFERTTYPLLVGGLPDRWLLFLRAQCDSKYPSCEVHLPARLISSYIIFVQTPRYYDVNNARAKTGTDVCPD